jgi:hypothetical protein
MRAVFFIVGVVLVIAGILLVTGIFQVGSGDEVLQLGDTAVEIGEGNIRLTDKGGNNRVLGIVLLVIGAVGIVAGVMSKK